MEKGKKGEKERGIWRGIESGHKRKQINTKGERKSSIENKFLCLKNEEIRHPNAEIRSRNSSQWRSYRFKQQICKITLNIARAF
jgi:hypothetical protein